LKVAYPSLKDNFQCSSDTLKDHFNKSKKGTDQETEKETMARVTGPFMSVDASGTIYNTLTASIWKGRNYIRGWFRPSNPKTDLQKAQRTLMQTAVATWQELVDTPPAENPGVDSLYKSKWNEAARECYPPLSGFNYYVMQYLRTGSAPTIPESAPRKSKSIHGTNSYGLDVGY